jgi:hypothetical protein
MTEILEHGGERDERPHREAAEAPRQLHRPSSTSSPVAIGGPALGASCAASTGRWLGP